MLARRVGLLVLLVVLGAATFLLTRKATPPDLPSAFTNTKQAVRYVGDAACTRCHTEIASAYATNAMARSIVPIDKATEFLRGKPGDTPELLFESAGMRYERILRDGKVFHREVRLDAGGKPIGAIEAEVTYALGSGTHATAFLLQRDDFLFQSPVTWYSQTGKWDMAPGYADRSARFERPITPGCLVCHANRFNAAAGTESRYVEPIFQGHSIGCERCHGPGELHVRDPKNPVTIVNPAKLETGLRNDVCQQCHLVGTVTIDRPGRDLTQYRPGLPLHEFATTFVDSNTSADHHKNADHVQQMQQSACFTKGGGQLGCISCHDPHQGPEADQKVDFYRERCLNCHADKGCSEPLANRTKVSPLDSCIDCHMPKATTSDVVHVATTRHNIPRRPDSPSPARLADPDAPPLVPFDDDRLTPTQKAERGRDLGIAMRQGGVEAASMALILLKKALERDPNDLDALESLGFAQWTTGRLKDAKATFDQVLRTRPEQESALMVAGIVAARLKDLPASAEFWRRATEANPWRSSSFASLAYNLMQDRRWGEALQAARKCVDLNPFDAPARGLLVECTYRTLGRAKARDELDVLIRLDPGQRDSLERWFAGLR